jgi:hypothetical protein
MGSERCRRPCCTWLGCEREPGVAVDYAQGKRRDLRLVWFQPYGGVNLCDRHAADLEKAGARVLSLARLE